MIRTVVAIDSKRGMADEQGIPWDIPGDKKYFRDRLQSGGLVLMGYGTYLEVRQPFGKLPNYVATSRTETLRDGFVTVADPVEFSLRATEDVWNIGGAGLLANTMDTLDELYITQLDGDFGCTKFFPPYQDDFELVSEEPPITENGITYRYQVWRRRQS
jgi:dihydrofolate reductase